MVEKMSDSMSAKKTTPRKIMLFHSGSIGDTIIIFPMLRAIRNKWRDAEIVLFTYSGYSGVACVRELVDRSGLVDRVIGFSTSGSKIGIVLRRSVLSMLVATLLMMLAAAAVFRFFGWLILTLLFGARFATVAPCTLILIEGALLWNAARFYADMLNSMRRERQAALIAGASALTSVVLYFAFCPRWGADGTAWAALTASAVWMLATLTSVLAVLRQAETGCCIQN